VKEAVTPPKTDDVETPPVALPEPMNTEPVKTEPAPVVIRKTAKQVVDSKPVKRGPVAAVETLRIPGAPQDVFVQSNPPGATALLDNRPDSACETPCLILASPGSHILSLTLASYQKEIRPVKVVEARVDVPLITLHPNGGTLMIVSDPPGANIFVDDRLMGSMTPAQIALPPGSYTIKVDLNGMRKTKRVDVANGSLERLKLVLSR
jgi:hypothetical protein